jgi:hypothetical protein
VISNSPPTEPRGELAQSSAEEESGKKPLWKMMVTPIILVLLGIALLPVALALYPSPAEASAPAYARLLVVTNQNITFIDYTVFQVTPTLAKVFLKVVRDVPTADTKAPAPFATIVFSPPLGTGFQSCHGGCARVRGRTPAFTWMVPLVFITKDANVYASFAVKAKSLGVSDNGVNAEVALPEVLYQGYGTPEILTFYHDIPSAASYDWSALPPAAYANSTIGWNEPVAGEDTQSKIAVGINQSRQSSDDHLAFIAGALIGVAGGAVLSGIQKVLENFLE